MTRRRDLLRRRPRQPVGDTAIGRTDGVRRSGIHLVKCLGCHPAFHPLANHNISNRRANKAPGNFGEGGSVKQVLIDRYGTPWDVARAADVPDVGDPGRRRSRVRRPGLSHQPGRHVVLPGKLQAEAAIAGDAGRRVRRSRHGRRRGGEARQEGRPRHQPATRELGPAPQGEGRRCDPAAGRHRSQAGGDGPHQSADGSAHAVRLRRSQARRLGDPERRQLGGRPAADRARPAARPAHGECRAAGRARGRTEGTRRRPGDRRWRRSRGAGRQGCGRRQDHAGRRGDRRRRHGPSRRLHRDRRHPGPLRLDERRGSHRRPQQLHLSRCQAHRLHVGPLSREAQSAADPRYLCRPRRPGDGRQAVGAGRHGLSDRQDQGGAGARRQGRPQRQDPGEPQRG